LVGIVSHEQILNAFLDYPIVQHYTEAGLEKFFRLEGAKVGDFAKSGLAQSICDELKESGETKVVRRVLTLNKFIPRGG
jgi:hypothetical protein